MRRLAKVVPVETENGLRYLGVYRNKVVFERPTVTEVQIAFIENRIPFIPWGFREIFDESGFSAGCSTGGRND